MDQSGSNLVLCEVKGNVATLMLNNPRRANALSGDMLSLMVSHLDSIEADPRIRVLVLTGKGKYFCTGMDLGASNQSKVKQNVSQVAAAFTMLCNRLKSCKLPIIVRLNGPAIGGGIGIAFLGDIRVAQTNVYFQFTEVQRGILPAMISTYIVPQLGPYMSKELMLSARKLSAEAAHAMHIISAVASTSMELNTVTQLYADRLLLGAPCALHEMKQLITYVASHTHKENVQEAIQVFTRQMKSKEAKYGIQSFRLKKRPNWDEFIQSQL